MTDQVNNRPSPSSPQPVDVKYSASRLTKYQPCTIDLRPARVVHYPDLNACLINERNKTPNHHNHKEESVNSASKNVDCRAVHFGYAIPISVVPVESEPELAELVLDAGADLTPAATSYLLQHHPQLREMQTSIQQKRSAAAAAPEAPDDDDIAAIAKQISDHAEAIYQTWKSRGLGPSELRNISTSAAQNFAPVLTPSPKSTGKADEFLFPKPDYHSPIMSPSPKPIGKPEFMSPKSIGKPEFLTPKPTTSPLSPLAKLTASKQAKHNNEVLHPTSPTEVTSVGLLNPSQLEYLVNSFVEEDKARLAAKKSPSSIQNAVKKFDQQAAASNNLSASPKTIAPPKKSTSYNSQENNISGLTTWPLKNHQHKDVSNKLNQTSPPTVHNELPVQYSPPPLVIQQQQQQAVSPTSPTKYATLPSKKHSSSPSAAVFLEEVAREEERLINALKTGCVVEDLDPSSCQKRTKLSDDEMSGLSRIDYAKIRYQAAQENPLTRQRLENVRELEHRKESQQAQHLASAVSEARSRFETSTNNVDAWKTSEWLPSKYAVDGAGALTPSPDTLPTVPLGRAARVKTARKSRAGEFDAAVPHPELTLQQKQHIKERGNAAAALAGTAATSGTNPIRPFLTRGSVAERVLIFEKCPPSEILNPLLEKRKAPPVITTWRSGNEVHSKTQTYSSRDRDCSSARGSPGSTTPTLCSPISQHATIPRFHFPRGRPTPLHESEAAKYAVIALFKTLPGERAAKENFADIAKACGFPMYWKLPLFQAAGGESSGGSVSLQAFLDLWTKMCHGGHDEAARMVWLLTRGQRSWLAPEDFVSLVQDVVDTHPGLSFLKEATEFHSRYVHTVIARMFYCANRSWSGRLSIPEIRRSQILPAVRQLEATADINQVTQFFSYEHFYVIYCKFWELDRDHDLFIDRSDLARHNDHALSTRMIDRIFSGAVTRGRRGVKKGEERMSYTEFVWFLLSEEDKTHPTAIEYWFRCMDLDGDGFLSMYELEYFYEEQLQRMEAIGMETLPFEDCLCQMLDMLRPDVHGKISLRDLKQCKLSPLFFDTFFNLEKFLDHEQRDPFATQPKEAAPDGSEMSDWDRYAAEEYELLVAEESGAEPPDDMMLYDDLSDDDDEDADEEDMLSPNLDRLEELESERRRGKPQDDDTWGSVLAGTEADEDSGDYAGDSDDYSF